VRGWTGFLLITLVVVVLRLPFLNQAIQGDDVYYLAGAEHAQIDPLHPNHARYAFQGRIVDMRGHPHPPLDAWYLAALLALIGTVAEIPYHSAYILFSCIAAWSAFSIARRLTARPFVATLLFLATPAFVVNGNSLESDLPFLAFWLASIAVFLAAVERRSAGLLALFVIPAALAAMAAYQSIVLVPILLFYLWLRRSDWKPAWAAVFAAPAVLLIWQFAERASTGALPATVLAGYMQTYDLQAFAQKIKSAVALTTHLGWVVFLPLSLAAFWQRKALWLLPLVAAAAVYDPNPLFWLSIATGLVILLWCALHAREFPSAWVLIFFASALVLFFAGSARYLLPLALPVSILVSQKMKKHWLCYGAAAGFALAIALALVNYRHWGGYRQFAASLRDDAATKRIWINGEWGLRFYLEREGAVPLLAGQNVLPGDIIVTSALAYPLEVPGAKGRLAEISHRDITSSIPLRLVSLNGKSAWSSTFAGLRPFDISTAPIDRVRAEMVVERTPTLSYLSMNAPEAERQIVSGIYGLDGNPWRWMGGQGVVALKPPTAPAPIEVKFVIPDTSPTRGVVLALDGHEIARRNYTRPGAYTIETDPLAANSGSAILSITADKTFLVPPDRRILSLILTSAGFQPASGHEAIAH
jgi:4-amino-4-deoxy-L-arabinose transferase-like glycosyltransferase